MRSMITEERVLDIVKATSQAVFSDREMSHMEIGAQVRHVEWAGRGMAVQMMMLVAATRPGEVEVAKLPATWLDYFKLRWFPKRALKKWPPQYRTIKVEVRGLLPMVQIPRGHRCDTIHIREAQHDMPDHVEYTDRMREWS